MARWAMYIYMKAKVMEWGQGRGERHGLMDGQTRDLCLALCAAARVARPRNRVGRAARACKGWQGQERDRDNPGPMSEQ